MLCSSPMKKVLLLVSAVVMLVLAACSPAPATPAKNTTPEPAQLVFDAKEFSFSPAQTTVRIGQSVQLVLKNTGVTLHDLSIEKIALVGTPVVKSDDADHMSGAMSDHMGGTHTEEMVVHIAADAGHSGSITFTPTEAGEYEFYCTVAGHKAAGMVGKLIVVQQ
jgi:uncharacterized cupredoxin-like copper-binding protein